MSFSNRIRQLSRLSRAHPLAVESDFESVKWTFPFLASGANTTPHYRTLIPNQTNMAMSFWFRVLDPSQTDDIGLGMMAQGSTQLAFGLSLSKPGSKYDLMLEYLNGSGLQTKQYDQFDFGDGYWHWVAITQNGASFTVYIDGWMDVTVDGSSIFDAEAFHLGHSTVGNTDCYATGIEFCDIRIMSDPTEVLNLSEYWNRPTNQSSSGGTTWLSKSGTELVSSPSGSNLLWAGAVDYDARLKTGFAMSGLRGYLSGFKVAYPSTIGTPGLHPIGRNILMNDGVSRFGLIDLRNLEVPSVGKTISASGNALSIPTTEQGIMDYTAHLLRETNLLQNGFVRRSY